MVDNVHRVIVHLHAIAAFSIVDSHERRPSNKESVIGSLLGVMKAAKGVDLYEIRSAYAVPHETETEEEPAVALAIDMKYENNMCQLNQAVNSFEVVLGWFQTSNNITMHSVLIHDYYAKRKERQLPPVCITLDGNLKSGKLNIKAFVRCKVGVPGKTQGFIFSPVPLEFTYFDPEIIGVQLLQNSVHSKGGIVQLQSRLDSIESILTEMDLTLERLLSYIKNVLDSTIPQNFTIGRTLMDLILTVPMTNTYECKLEQIGSMQDLLMVMYLVNLTMTQLQLGETVSHLK